jgi:PLP dependent protein
MEKTISFIRDNINRVLQKIDKAAILSNRSKDDVRLVVVTKAQPFHIVQAAILAGAKTLGENYPDDALQKIDNLRNFKEIEWHMIGHLQSRKARIVIENFTMLHSLDSISLAQKLDKLCKTNGRLLPVLLEFNVGGEETKNGWPAWEKAKWLHLIPVVEEISQLTNLKICGSMTMPPWADNPERTRPYFTTLHNLADYLNTKIPDINLSELSMGTSIDFEVAIQEGATMVRIGEAILGARPPKSQGPL